MEASKPVSFLIQVTDTKATPETPCLAGHQVGARWECDGIRAPGGFCLQALHDMYTILEILRHGADIPHLAKGGDRHTINYTCPDNAWVTFEIKRIEG